MRKEPNPSCQYVGPVRQRWVRLSLRSFKVSFPQTNKHKLASITSGSPFKHVKLKKKEKKGDLKRRKQPLRLTFHRLRVGLFPPRHPRLPVPRFPLRSSGDSTHTHTRWPRVGPSVRPPARQPANCMSSSSSPSAPSSSSSSSSNGH